MALVVNDRVKQTSTTTGTGTLDLSAAAADGFQTFVAGVGDTNTTYYAIFNQGTTEWEVGLGTVTDAATDTLARTSVISSSNSGSAVDFASGTKDVFCTLPASKTVFGKQEGTNFTNSLLVGHSTTGTLNAAVNNTGVGIGCLEALTTGDSNTCVGLRAGEEIDGGDNNTCIGVLAGQTTTTSDQNTLIGYNAGGALTTGTSASYNVALGYGALAIATSAANNTCLGRNSGEAISFGDYNILVGHEAGENLSSGSGNVCIGNKIDFASATGDRQLLINGWDGSTATTWITGDSSGNLVIQGTATAAGGQLTTIGKAFVMGF